MATDGDSVPPTARGMAPISAEERQAIVAALESGRLDEAEARCRPFLERPDSLEALLLMACIRSAQGKHDMALALFADLVEMAPHRADITYNQGSALRRAGRLTEAVDAWRRTLRLRPDLVAARHHLAMALREMGDLAGAIEAFETLLELSPESEAEALLQIGNLCYLSGDIEAAISRYRALVNHHPREPLGWTRLGQALKATGKYDEAERSYRRALEFSPDFDAAALNLGCLLLSAGRWQEGFAFYERRRPLNRPPQALTIVPDWQGDEPSGSVVGLWNDLTFGDAIQFARFAPVLARRGHRPVLLVDPPLRRLLATIPDVEVATPDASPPSFDAEMPLASLPHRLGIGTTERLWSGPYLTAPEVFSSALPHGRLRIGLVWAAGAASYYLKDSTLTLDDLAPLFDLPDIAWLSLQMGPHAADRDKPTWKNRITDATAGLNDFAATAALINQIDLVISVDTAVPHLAGALGRPAWVLLPHDADWRWGHDGETTPWYPSLRLFRQPTSGQWGAPVQAIAAALREML